MTCIKTYYSSERLAREAINKLHVRWKAVKCKILKRVYFCDICKLYHLTSMSTYEPDEMYKKFLS